MALTYGLVQFLDKVVGYHAYKLGLDLDCLEIPQLVTIHSIQALVCMLVVELDASHLKFISFLSAIIVLMILWHICHLLLK